MYNSISTCYRKCNHALGFKHAHTQLVTLNYVGLIQNTGNKFTLVVNIVCYVSTYITDMSQFLHSTPRPLHTNTPPTHSPQEGRKATDVIGEGGTHWRQKFAWNPAGTCMGSVLHSSAVLARRPPPRLLWGGSGPRKISAFTHCTGDEEREREY